MTRHQRLRQLEIQIVEFVTVFAADLHGIAEAGGGEQRRGCPFALDQCIGDQSRAMEQGSALAGFNGAGFKHRPERVFDGETRVAGCGQGFADDNGAVLSHQKEIGESSADIDADAIHE